MDLLIDRSKEPVKAKRITIVIDEIRYNILETQEGSLMINKVSDIDSSKISIFPSASNQIEIL